VDDGGSLEEGFGFIWRRPNGSLQGARGQARRPSLKIARILMAVPQPLPAGTATSIHGQLRLRPTPIQSSSWPSAMSASSMRRRSTACSNATPPGVDSSVSLRCRARLVQPLSSAALNGRKRRERGVEPASAAKALLRLAEAVCSGPVGVVLPFLLALMAALQPAAAEAPAQRDVPLLEEQRLADSFTLPLPAGAEGCVTRPENRERVAAVLRQAGFTLSARSRESDRSFTLYTEPKRRFDRLIYHYVQVFDALCASGPCLSSYAARIELPVGEDGTTQPDGAINDPDRVTLALFEAVEGIGTACGGRR
jgi:hypothetical protein